MSTAQPTPKHIAIVMDGNGRWAQARDLPRISGHEAGAESVRQTIQSCIKQGIEVLTLFAFSAENWGRPQDEVDALMQLFVESLNNEADELASHNVRLRIIGDRSRFSQRLQQAIADAEQKTVQSSGLMVVIAVNYSGRWDLTQATQTIAQHVANGQLAPSDVDEACLSQHLCLADLPEPDLLIRTSGEIRLSNFLLWQVAYAELYFTPVLWPDFNAAEFEKALAFYRTRERRFGLTQSQTQETMHAE